MRQLQAKWKLLAEMLMVRHFFLLKKILAATQIHFFNGIASFRQIPR